MMENYQPDSLDVTHFCLFILRSQTLALPGGMALPGMMTSVVMDSVVLLPTYHLKGSLRKKESLIPSTMCTGQLVLTWQYLRV